MSVNVGLVTSPSKPRPRASPLTSCVLPAPSTPCSAKISPPARSFARLSPKACVASMLLKMVKPIRSPGKSRRYATTARYSNEMQRHGEWPLLFQGFCALGPDGEKQLVVLAVVDRGGERRTVLARDLLRSEMEAHARGFGQ